ELSLVLGLFVQRRRRREAQMRLAERLRFEALVTEVGAALTVVPASGIDAQIRSCLRRVATFLSVDRGTLWRAMPDGAALEVTYWWCADGVPAPPPSLDLQRFPYFRARVTSVDGVVSFERLEELPHEAAAERAAFGAEGVRSLAAIPLCVADRSLGLLAFASLRAERAWPTEFMQQFLSLAQD